ncbi:calcium-binding protein CAST [Helianthus annuus]|uniref:calcium-binding protein CAST n=1 Tax=Helianthus annuus TaxID=4232 RepID=UPI000B8F1162|nr:calcium-binding protein CAST [Helianthus annuus]
MVDEDDMPLIAMITSIRLVLAIAALRNLEVHQIDVKTAFLNGDLKEEIYMEQSDGFSAPGNECKLINNTKQSTLGQFYYQALHKEIDDLFFRLDDNDDLSKPDEEEQDGDGDKHKEADMMEAFKVFDEDEDGYISAKELQTVLVKLGFAEGNEFGRVEMMISSVDRNHDGLVDFTEFKDMMRIVIVLR